MLGATMASISDGCVSEQRDPCASPPCKRLKQVALPVECIVIEDSNESTTGPSTNEASHAEAPTLNETTTSENQPIESVSHTEQCMRNSDVTSMETEGLESQFEHKSEVLPQLPVMLETKSDVKSISVNNSNGTMLNGNGASNSSMNAETNGDEKEVPSCIPPKVKDSATLLKFFKPVTPGSKSTIVENMKKTPSKNDGETVLKSNNEDVVISSPCSPVNTSPDTLEMTAIKKTPSPPPASSDDKTTPRRKTPGRKLSVEEKQKREEERLRKQKEKEALEKERLEKKKEKERLREERLKEKMEAKQKKEQERSEQQEMKKQRERERIEKKEQDEKERKEKLEKKEAEKKKKEDEKNLKNEEKRRKEEEEMLKKKKAMNSFAKFFIKKEATVPAKPKEQVPKQSKFQPFELKPFMKLASTPYRKPLSENDRQQLSRTIVEQVTTNLRQVKKELLALREIAREIKREDEQTEAQRATDKGDDDIMIIDDEDVCSDSKTQKESTEQELSKVKAKLLQFHENYRPAYFGSWRKNSSNVGPRTPFKKDEVLMNYEVDSDEEWEEEEPGESLSNSEGEDEDESGPNEDEDDQDGFFVPHGYLSDDEGDADGKDDAMEQDSEKISQLNSEDKMERHLAKQKTWEAELKRQFKPMKPVAIGCVWEEEMPAILKQLEACCMLAVDNIDPTTARKEHQENAVNSSLTTTATYCNTAMPVPEEAMPFLIKMLHGSVAGLQKLVRLFRKRWTLETNKADSRVSEETWEQHCTVSKRQVERKITAIANKEIRPPTPKPRWYVGSKILALYKMENIELATNGLIPTVFASKEKSTSPVLQKRILQTKSPIISSFSNTKDAPIAKVIGIIEEEKSDDTEVVSMDTTPPVRLE